MEDKKGFTVVDRRMGAEPEPAPEPEAPKSEARPEPEPPKSEERAEPRGPLPAVDFATFVLSISTHIPVYLGEMADPYSGKTDKDLPLAQHLIDTLAMLEEKTRGNLSKTEENLINGLLYDFRVRFVKAVQ